MGDEPIARPLPTRMTTQTQNKRTQTSMTPVGLERTNPMFQRVKAVHALDRAATVIGRLHLYGATFKNIYYDSFVSIMEMAPPVCQYRARQKLETGFLLNLVLVESLKFIPVCYQFNITSLRQIIKSNSML
jgi:hypothetical protein